MLVLLWSVIISILKVVSNLVLCYHYCLWNWKVWAKVRESLEEFGWQGPQEFGWLCPSVCHIRLHDQQWSLCVTGAVKPRPCLGLRLSSLHPSPDLFRPQHLTLRAVIHVVLSTFLAGVSMGMYLTFLAHSWHRNHVNKCHYFSGIVPLV